MTESNSSEETSARADGAGEELILISANRSRAEKRDAYKVEWREPANELSLADKVRGLF